MIKVRYRGWEITQEVAKFSFTAAKMLPHEDSSNMAGRNTLDFLPTFFSHKGGTFFKPARISTNMDIFAVADFDSIRSAVNWIDTFEGNSR
jgi:hypothetical protein